ncbi:glycerophosphodiester phosphodiesterase family protein [Thalassotalea ponticola]|uniref:glycerophosphodiester phosphodiesterase n=1 Tax=Thalassotalea ponticola TaxID=1523392 RepID=UPI0025B30270|nr:glycerophosphodiester phosphodiesterase family protein [Thalassotalea ponticola]MDN3653006.1 glycerophosphodiester phosphodiesterase family protein [Thalassotalea ponticola]
MLVVAHRGASGHEPENTLLAIEKALEMNVDAIEIDVHWADGELIVIHDRNVGKTTNGQGLLSKLTFAEIRQLDAGKGQRVPTLDEVLQLINGQCPVNIELKADKTVVPTLALIEKAIKDYHFDYNKFLVSSFNHHLLFQVKTLNPAIHVGALTASCPLDYAAFAEKLSAYSVHIDVDFINKAFVDDAHQRGMKVFVYTVDDEDDIIEMHHLGVDGIFSNYPTQSLLKIAHLTSAPKPEAPLR